MFNKKWSATAAVSIIMLAGCVQAESNPKQPAVTPESGETTTAAVTNPADASVKEKIQKGFHRVSKSLNIVNVNPTPLEGIYLVEGANGELLYANADGEFILAGDMLKIKDGGLENLTDKVRGEKAIKALSAVPAKDMVIYSPKGTPKQVMYVFTDVECGYCRKLHQEVPKLNEAGVEVRYLAFPRGGDKVPAYKKMVSAWCAKDPKEALSKLKSGDTLPAAECDNAVLDQYNLGLSLSVQGTPAIYLGNGQMIPGFRPAEALLKIMRLDNPG